MNGKGFCLGVLLFLGAGRLAAQDTLRGKILDENLPLQGATVALGKLQTTTTDSAGSFTFSDIPEGKYSLEITMAGYAMQRIPVLLQRGAPPVTVHMRATGSLNEVVVSGTLRPVQRLQSPVAVEVYTPQFFKKNPSPSVFESLQMVNGVRPQINCSVCNTGDIHINGLEGPYTMVTIDGMPIVSSLSTVYGLFGIPNSLIEKVEIIKGPASGLYGSEAIGGLINIITKTPAKAPVFAIETMGTSWLEHNLDIGFKLAGKKLSSLSGVHYYRYGSPQDHNRDGFTDVTLQHRFSVFNKWQLHRAKGRTAALAARYFYEDRWGGDMRWNRSFRGTDSIYGESIYTSRVELIGNYTLPFPVPIQLSFSGTQHEQNSYYGNIPYNATQRIGFTQLLWNKVLGRHALLVGAAARYNYYDDNSTATRDTVSGANAPDQHWLPGIFIQDEWLHSDKHRLLVGFRYDHHKVHGSILTPRLAYKMTFSSRSSLRINTGTGFRVVNLFTEDHAALTGARKVVISEKLRPEKSMNVNLNFIRQMGSNSRPVQLDATIWYTYFHNQIRADYDSNPQEIRYANLDGHALSKGLSVNADFNWMRRLKGNFGVTFQDITAVEKNKGAAKVVTRPVLTERFSGTWAITYQFPQAGLTIDYTGNIYGPMRLPLASDLDPRKEYSPLYSVQNIQLTKWLSARLECFGGIKNMLDWTPAKNNPFLIARAHDPFDKLVQYESDGSVKQTAENPYKLTFDPNYVFAPNQGRRAFIGVKWKIN